MFCNYIYLNTDRIKQYISNDMKELCSNLNITKSFSQKDNTL